MSTIKIEHIGAISKIDINLNKINIIIGPQSSGKSTIAKIISYCQWVEKRHILDGEFNYDFKEQFIEFHRIGEDYFNKNSLIEYESEYVKFSYKGLKHKFSIKKSNESSKYLKSKNIYIPAERNFVSVIPNLSKYKETNDNIMSFLYDWYDTKKKYKKKNTLKILNLDVSYYHSENTDADIIQLNKVNKEISLQNASSGLQSIIPLTMIIDYLCNGFFSERISNSVSEKDEIAKMLVSNFLDIFNIERIHDFEKTSDGNRKIKLSQAEAVKFTEIMNSRSRYHFSNFVVEEPEQNLYPETQRDFIYYLIENLNNTDRNHKALLTTHSAYILYALNNCMMGYRIKDSIDESEKNEFQSFKSWINPDLVSVWEIDSLSGTLNNIKDSKTGTLSKNYFNQFTNELLDEYYKMLSYLEI
jgi:ABC-type dipeptide/oligopeptide/nickel transport system ATPase component